VRRSDAGECPSVPTDATEPRSVTTDDAQRRSTERRSSERRSDVAERRSDTTSCGRHDRIDRADRRSASVG
jgi:hypothetical protein